MASFQLKPGSTHWTHIDANLTNVRAQPECSTVASCKHGTKSQNKRFSCTFRCCVFVFFSYLKAQLFILWTWCFSFSHGHLGAMLNNHQQFVM